MTFEEQRSIAHQVLDVAINSNLIRLYRDTSIPGRPRWVMKLSFLGVWFTIAEMPLIEDNKNPA